MINLGERMKKPILIIGIDLLLVSFVLSGCLSSGGDVKITSVDMSKNHPNYTFTIGLKNVGQGDKTTITAYLSIWTEYWYSLDHESRVVGYIDQGDTTTTTLTVNARYAEGLDLYKIDIVVDTENGDKQKYSVGFGMSEFGTDFYTDEFWSES